LWAGLAVLCGVEGGVGDGWHPGDAEEGVAQGGQDVGVVLGGGGDVAADGVAVAGDLLGAESAGYFLLGLCGPQVAFCLVRRRGNAQVGGEPEDVGLPVAQAFEQVAAGPLLAACDLGHLGQADQDAVLERVGQRGGDVAGDGGQALGAGGVRGVDQALQRLGDRGGPVRAGVLLGGVLQIAQQVLRAELVDQARGWRRSSGTGRAPLRRHPCRGARTRRRSSCSGRRGSNR
jgi:hypothetical protein